MDEIFTIILADGTRIENLIQNGTNYVSEDMLDADMFVNNCCPLTIQCGEEVQTYENAELVHISQETDGCYIAFRETPENKVREAKLRSDIDYLAMMTGTDLEEV